MILSGDQISTTGKYSLRIEVQQISLLMKQYNYAAKVVTVTERTTGHDVTEKFRGELHEHYGVLTADAIEKALTEAEQAIGIATGEIEQS